ncbi:MAG: flagellar hook-basal body complex protein FliE [Planctomycetes bacterium]|nr:flagellar hook-basal body complex protein FliE [Planctomycetota bacterium]MBI3843021.1 flagellar hook-basal body complex protein FliE [Planctomycetota bacterium]
MEIRGIPRGDDGSIASAGAGGIGKFAAKGNAAERFSDVLSQLLSDVNRLQTDADAATKGVATGSSDDLHRVMIALSKADLSMRLLVEVRNRAMEAYQEISRLPL